MASKYLDKVFYRAAGAALSALPTIGGTYPTMTISGWTEVVGAVAEKAKLGIDADAKSAMGDGTEMVSSEKAPVELTVKNFTKANYDALRSAFLNQKVDVIMLDNEVRTVAYAVQGVRLYPKIDVTGGEEPQIVISGERKAGAGITNAPFVVLGT